MLRLPEVKHYLSNSLQVADDGLPVGPPSQGPDVTATALPAIVAPVPEEERQWRRLLVWGVLVSSIADLTLMALTGEVIPPVAVGAVLSIAGVATLRRFPRGSVLALGIVSLLLVVTGAPFVVPLLGQLASGVDFLHAAVHVGGRLTAIVAAAGLWRRWASPAATWLGRLSVAALSVAVLLAVFSLSRVPRDAPAAGDVAVEIRDFAFPSTSSVSSGEGLFVRNADLVGHTFSVEGTNVAHELPGQARLRFTVDLDPGTYQVFCAVPGHQAMKGDLIVE